MGEDEERYKKKPLRKITRQRLKNIALYYLERFESSSENLRKVLSRRVNDYAYQNQDFNKSEALVWIEEIVQECQSYKYLDDNRFAELKIRDYLAAGKSEKYIAGKMMEKGIKPDLVGEILAEQEFDPYENALRLAKKKHIGPFRSEEERKEFYQKDLGVLVRAGFDYDLAKQIISSD